MENNETYFKILLDKIEELVRENERYRLQISEIEGYIKDNTQETDLDRLRNMISDDFWNI